MDDMQIVVYGATGHTGRFVTGELIRRGLEPVLSGRDPSRLADLPHPGPERRPAAAGDPAALRKALHGAAAVINCAGPFADTALPVATAAVRAGIPYLDVTAEQSVVALLRRELDADARAAGVPVVPAAAFFGGLADLLATAALTGPGTGTAGVDEITVAIALDRWWPTPGTRATGARNGARRLEITGGGETPLPEPPPTRTWTFPEPFGAQEVVALPFAETLTMSAHLEADTIRSWMAQAPLRDLRDPATPAPTGRTGQRFVMEVVIGSGGGARRATASGTDIYAVSAPIAVELATRLVGGAASGVVSPGAVADARSVLRALSPDPITIQELSTGLSTAWV